MRCSRFRIPRGGVADAEELLDPVADLLRGEEAAGSDLVLEAFNLSGAKFAGVSLEAEGTEGIQAVETKAAKPLADLAGGDAEKIGDFLLAATVVGPQDGGEAVGYSLVQGVATAGDDVGADGRFQEQSHNEPPEQLARRESGAIPSHQGGCRNSQFAETIARECPGSG
jgi:hypothetical protein